MAHPTSLRKPKSVFMTGGTGYIGRRLIERLLERGHSVRALARAASADKLPAGCTRVIGNALDADSFAAEVPPADTFVQLVGAPHPAPWKARSFETVDLVAGNAGVDAARRAGVSHFIYVSVAQPAPVMRAYQRVRAAVEAHVQASGLAATVLRPWYVLGPGHWWPIALVPGYAFAERIPALRPMALRLGLVSIRELVDAAVFSIEERGANQYRILDVPAIRSARRNFVDS